MKKQFHELMLISYKQLQLLGSGDLLPTLLKDGDKAQIIIYGLDVLKDIMNAIKEISELNFISKCCLEERLRMKLFDSKEDMNNYIADVQKIVDSCQPQVVEQTEKEQMDVKFNDMMANVSKDMGGRSTKASEKIW
ncbi:unnamed protein product [Moneuplotes crassus]|uniref:Uncharacterized protein n=1 Tax=Euplotes crassus TaxID=5936 RepID=A0AAD1XWQ7_EUPCR|nr:unnamed protein product [Moneuplotes crassus]